MDSFDRVVVFIGADEGLRQLVADLCCSTKTKLITFALGADYLAAPAPDVPACLIVDLELPDANGLELQEQMAGTHHPPIVFVAATADVRSSVRAIKAGAVDFLPKPVDPLHLMSAIGVAVHRDRDTRRERLQRRQLGERYARLSPRERQVLPLVAAGRLNKQSAAELGISETTLQIHRRNVMRKMAAGSLPDLVRMAAALELPLPAPRVINWAALACEDWRPAVGSAAGGLHCFGGAGGVG
jgi:FixJ family two-component response regulator